jgi:DNA-directed RNA polymerase specialized sigma24 family protein
MATRRAETVPHGLSRLVEAQSAQLSDGQLLRRFAAHRDQGAFAVLVHRHGPLVFGVCRNILRSQHDAEDAFQGTFLVLARRAGVIREGQALGSWLYRVAYRVSMKARLAADRRRRREDQAARPPEDWPAGDIAVGVHPEVVH